MTGRRASVRLEPDALPGSRVMAWLLAAWLIMGALTLWAWGILAGSERARRAQETVAHEPRAEISRVNQWLFVIGDPRGDVRAAEQRRLATFGWVDRAGGLVRVPIEDAFQLLLQEERR